MLHHCYCGLASIHDGANDQQGHHRHPAIQQTGLYKLAILELNGFDPVNKDWLTLISYFGKVYDVRLRLEAGTVNINGYHDAANATNGVDDDGLVLIHKSFGIIQVANNVNFQVTNGTM